MEVQLPLSTIEFPEDAVARGLMLSSFVCYKLNLDYYLSMCEQQKEVSPCAASVTIGVDNQIMARSR